MESEAKLPQPLLEFDPPLKKPQAAPREDRTGEQNGHSQSPLWMVTREHRLNELVVQLQSLRRHLIANPAIPRVIRFSRKNLDEVRNGFAAMICRGESKLHQLSGLLAHTFLDHFQVESVVIGEVETTGETFTLSQNIPHESLFTTTDIDLGNRQLGKLRFFDGNSWSAAGLVANVVDYHPIEPNRYTVHRITSRIKAEEEIWNKVVDEIFNLDSIVKRDKKLRHLSRYVKDVFGIKIVAGTEANVRDLHRALQALQW